MDSSAGTVSGRTIRRAADHLLPPHMSAASSKEGSCDRNAAAMIRKASGAQWMPAMKIIPGSEKMSNGIPSPVRSRHHPEMIPALGPISRIQPMANRTPGMIRGIRLNARKADRSGVSVRSVIHARPVPMTSATSDEPSENASELKMSSMTRLSA